MGEAGLKQAQTRDYVAGKLHRAQPALTNRLALPVGRQVCARKDVSGATTLLSLVNDDLPL